jgi:suppressor for copper-sensitivity B
MTANLLQNRRWSLAWVLGLALLLCTASVARGQGTEPAPKLNLLKDFNFLGGAGGDNSQKVTFAGSFMCERESRRGTLTLSATIEPGWHVYSLTQKKGGPEASDIKVASAAFSPTCRRT